MKLRPAMMTLTLALLLQGLAWSAARADCQALEEADQSDPSAVLSSVTACLIETRAALAASEHAQEELRRRLSAGAWEGLPKGTILGWYASAPPPPGWALCDGQQGTPDLRGRFLMGAETAGLEGGANRLEEVMTEAHSLTLAEIPRHDHDVRLQQGGGHDHKGRSGRTLRGIGYRNVGTGQFGATPSGEDPMRRSGEHDHAISQRAVGANQAHAHGLAAFDNRPAYVTLVFIMKVE